MDDLISRQAAIEALKRAEALTRAFGYHNVIETIRELPAAEPEPSQVARDIATIIENEQDMRVILSHPKKGKWMPNNVVNAVCPWCCSECNSNQTNRTPYCQMCGAKMEVEHE